MLFITSGRKEVEPMGDILIAFLISIIAGVASYYICKWLDRGKK